MNDLMYNNNESQTQVPQAPQGVEPAVPEKKSFFAVLQNKKILLVVALVVLLAILVIITIALFGNKKDGEQTNLVPVDERFKNDIDRDGLDDKEEEKLGTSNKSFDTDRDTLTDKIEIEVLKTDPTNPDTDGDGVSDGLEVARGTNPLGN